MDPAQHLAGIDLNLLVVLDVLLEERSVTRAAARLRLSQPAVSNALARLRTTLGDPLLVRAAGGMAPTPHALALAAPLRDALQRIGQVVAGPDAFDPATTRRAFTLAATDYVQFALLGPLAQRLATEAPGIALRVVSVQREFPWAELESGRVHLTLGGVAEAPRGLHQRTLFQDRVVCMVRADHPAKAPWDLERYLSLGHIEALPVESDGLADQVLADLGHSRHLAVTVPQFLVAPFLVAQTDYCFTLAQRIAEPLAALLPLEIRPLPFDVPGITIRAFWHERVHDDQGHQWFRRLLAEIAAEL